MIWIQILNGKMLELIYYKPNYKIFNFLIKYKLEQQEVR